MRTLKPLSIGAALLCASIFLTACNDEPAPDFSSSTPVAYGSQPVYLSVAAWRVKGSQPCRVRIQGAEVTNWVKPTGVLPRMTLAPAVVHACTGRTPYLSSVSGQAEGGAAEWNESSGPDSATALSRYQVLVTALSDDEARLELQVLSGK